MQCPSATRLVVLVDADPRQYWLRTAVERRLREEFATLQVEVNEERVGEWTSGKASTSDSSALSSVGFAVGEADGCRYRRRKAKSERHCCGRSSRVFRSHRSRPVAEVIDRIIPSCVAVDFSVATA